MPDSPSPPSLPVAPAPLFTPEELAEFKAQVSGLIDLDLNAYKPRQVERRITALMHRASMTNLSEFYRLLRTDDTRLQDFKNGLTINVSSFFRDTARFEELEQRVLPDLLTEFPRLRIWSAGCSMGAELYSVGLVLQRLGALDRCELIGTDWDAQILERAQAGHYHPHELEGLEPEIMAMNFAPLGKMWAFTNEAVKARASFMRHNLLADSPVPHCQLVMCRNVVIYLNLEGKATLYERFREALAPGGVLFVGNTERIFDHRALGFELSSPYFYRRAT